MLSVELPDLDARKQSMEIVQRAQVDRILIGRAAWIAEDVDAALPAVPMLLSREPARVKGIDHWQEYPRPGVACQKHYCLFRF